MKGFPDLPPIWWAGSMICIHLAHLALPHWHVDVGHLSYLSSILFFGALGIVAWSGLWFWRKKTPIEPHQTPKTLIKEGPYRISRNPIYLALVMLTLASAIAKGSLVGLLLTALLWVVLDRRFAQTEETLLVETFGDEAREYLAQTRRWL